MTNTFLIGKKTVLRPIHPTDVTLFTRWVNEPDTNRYTSSRFPMTELGEEEWIKKASVATQYPSNVRLVIETKKGSAPIGIINLHAIDWIHRHATTGSMIGEAKYRGKGYATDAKMTLLEYAFDRLGMHKIISRADARNVKSIEYSKRCGYVVEATLKEEIFDAGKWRDIVSLACFRDSWKKARAGMEN